MYTLLNKIHNKHLSTFLLSMFESIPYKVWGTSKNGKA